MLTPSLRITPKLIGAIFAGGESRRMGEPKEGVSLWDGRPMLAHVIDALAPLCEKIAIVGHCRGFNIGVDSRLIQVPDRQPGLGPMAALESLLSSGLGTHYLVASCDQPLLTPVVLKLLVADLGEALETPRFFKAPDGEELDPFPGVYPESLLPLTQQTLSEQKFAMRQLLRRVAIRWVELPVEQKVILSNCNTPESIATVSALRKTEEMAR